MKFYGINKTILNHRVIILHKYLDVKVFGEKDRLVKSGLVML